MPTLVPSIIPVITDSCLFEVVSREIPRDRGLMRSSVIQSSIYAIFIATMNDRSDWKLHAGYVVARTLALVVELDSRFMQFLCDRCLTKSNSELDSILCVNVC